ncbi:hypothetical protein NLU13_8139 [Sarocladium strictum]|uniref:Glycosyl transferase CAP10 domain-containing protein n=1 Tax=Sarocladium strictum TaxID=5046 RepID=A0AA39L4V6_SARSR|nr:hypothetical protein NLU13_8139 [Sarocladium strictum]
MHTPLSSDPGPFSIAWPAVSAIASVATRYFSDPDAELPSEILCWAILPLLFSRSQGHATKSSDVASSVLGISAAKLWAAVTAPLSSLTAVAVGVGAAAFAASEFKSQAFLPALPPLVLFAQRRLHVDGRSRLGDCSASLSTLIESPLVASALALFSVVALSKGDILSSLSSVPVLLALFTVYVTLSLSKSSSSSLHTLNIEEAVIPLSVRASVVSVGLLLVRCMFLRSGWPGIATVLALGFSKSCLWYSTILTTRHSQWLVAPVGKVFGVMAVVDFLSLTSEYQALSHLLASILSLGQLIALQPQHAKSRHYLWLLALVPVVPYLFTLWNIRAWQSNAPDWDSGQLHPLDKLIEDAQQEFYQMRKRQSITYGIAEEEYRRRYGIDPPPGFEAWFDYAVSNDSPIIDEFDTLFESISPYLKLSGKQVNRLMKRIQETPLNELWTCSFEGETPEAACHHRKRNPKKDRDITRLLNELLGNVGSQLRGIQVLVNHLDEPRVLFPPRSTPDGNFQLRNIKRENTWSDVTTHCPSNEEDWNAKHPLVKQYDLPFVANRSSIMDLCQHAEYENMHGLLLSPKNLRLIEGHVPVLGTGSFSTMGDILIPSPAYIQQTFLYDDGGDVAWEKKRNNLYWDGSNTGGYAKKGDPWLKFHRQRFVSFVQRLENRSYYYLQSARGKVVRTASKMLNGRLYDVAFTRILQCDPSTCHEQRDFFRTRSWTPPTAALHSRLVFDLDGNGISGRFYRLLASHSLPLKQTLLREWHDERLVPWVHYVPISQGMEELPEVVRWLTSTERGQMRAREMAEAGRRWYYEAIRDVDKGLYLYRVLLELGRVQDEKRGAGES